MYSYGPPHMAEQKQNDQLEHTYSRSVRIRDVALKTCRRRWTIGRSGERGSRISVQAERDDDDDDIRTAKCWAWLWSLLPRFHHCWNPISSTILGLLFFNIYSNWDDPHTQSINLWFSRQNLLSLLPYSLNRCVTSAPYILAFFFFLFLLPFFISIYSSAKFRFSSLPTLLNLL